MKFFCVSLWVNFKASQFDHFEILKNNFVVVAGKASVDEVVLIYLKWFDKLSDDELCSEIMNSGCEECRLGVYLFLRELIEALQPWVEAASGSR